MPYRTDTFRIAMSGPADVSKMTALIEKGALDPAAIGPVDWLFSDVICYPARLLALVERWLAAGLARNFVCTLKFQGETDLATAGRFAAIPGSRLLHLHHNKHELTWIRLGDSGFR